LSEGGGVPPVVAVVIPYYQRDTGLLHRAVTSALAQDGVDVRVFVVDDGSPCPAAEALAAVSSLAVSSAAVTIIRQANAGPGAARNRGLAAIPDEIEYVAFLDSDDSWVPEHLARAVSMFSAGADLYFSDYVPLHSERSTFDLCGFLDRPAELVGDELYVCGGDLFEPLFRRSPVGTSTVVFRRSIADRGFPTDFSYGEDVFFWMHLARNATNVAFSTRCEAIYGAGLNIAASASWGSPTILKKLHSEYRFHRAAVRSFPMSGDLLAWSRAYRGGVYRSFRANFLHLLRRGDPVNWRHAAEMVAMEARRRLFERDIAGQ